MEEKLKKFKSIIAEAADLKRAVEILGWDQETNMPPGGAEARGDIRATLEKNSHEKYTSDELARLLEELEPFADELDPDSDDACLIKFIRRDVDRKNKLPAEMVAEKARLIPPANMAWREAREKSEWSIFEPHVEKVVDYVQRMAEYYKPYDHIYDPLLDEYEPGMKTKEVQAIFSEIRPKQAELIEAISKQPQVDDSVILKNYPKAKQLAMGNEIIKKFGYDFNRGRMDEVHHPFASTLGYGDNRITYRLDENYFNSFLFAIMHESGHAMYEQGIAKELARTPLYKGASYAIHESQSRLWENLVGRSKAFWEWFYPKLQDRFPSQVGDVSLDDFYKAINKVEPSFIRVEADEATYNLHIMLRLEIEIALLEGEIKVKDLPEFWNTRFKEYLGITPKNDAEGVLQDVHWSFGLYGYFSTYALGNLVSLQLWEKIKADIPNLEDQIRKGEFTNLLSWLQDKVYRHGKKFAPQELVKRITGSKIDGEPYIKYLNEKFGEIYGL
jgi:carboxypeptidase Taq